MPKRGSHRKRRCKSLKIQRTRSLAFMLKKGKKFLMLLLALALSAGTMAGCGKTLNRKPLDGYVSSENAAESNGGFVVKKDSWYYFINGAEDYSADNTFGNVVKGSLMRISWII